MEITNRWYSLKEICEYLGVSRDTVFKWIENKNMPAHKMGRQWKFKTDEELIIGLNLVLLLTNIV